MADTCPAQAGVGLQGEADGAPVSSRAGQLCDLRPQTMSPMSSPCTGAVIPALPGLLQGVNKLTSIHGWLGSWVTASIFLSGSRHTSLLTPWGVCHFPSLGTQVLHCSAKGLAYIAETA